MLSKPKLPSPPFVPTLKVGLGIFIENYDKTKYGNLKQVRDDAERVQKFFKRLGCEDIKILFDVNYEDLEELVTIELF